VSAAQVTLRGVTKVFPAGAGGEPVHALGPIDIEIRKGEFFAVVGPSGCGKSTLLELIAGLTSPTLGEIEFEGRAIKDTVPDGIGVVFQEDACFSWLNVSENIEFGLRQKMIATEEKVRRVAAVRCGGGVRWRAWRVRGPTMASVVRWWWAWRRRTAAAVAGPKRPSMPAGPRW